MGRGRAWPMEERAATPFRRGPVGGAAPAQETQHLFPDRTSGRAEPQTSEHAPLTYRLAGLHLPNDRRSWDTPLLGFERTRKCHASLPG